MEIALPPWLKNGPDTLPKPCSNRVRGVRHQGTPQLAVRRLAAARQAAIRGGHLSAAVVSRPTDAGCHEWTLIRSFTCTRSLRATSTDTRQSPAIATIRRRGSSGGQKMKVRTSIGVASLPTTTLCESESRRSFRTGNSPHQPSARDNAWDR